MPPAHYIHSLSPLHGIVALCVAPFHLLPIFPCRCIEVSERYLLESLYISRLAEFPIYELSINELSIYALPIHELIGGEPIH